MPREKIVIGIDSGTSACKVAAFNLRGEPVAEATAEHEISYPRLGWAEQDAEWWWRAAAASLRKVTEKLENYEIIGVGVDSQREAVVPLSEDGDRLSKSIIWLDQRAVEVLPKIRELVDEEEVIERTGVSIDPIFSAAKLLWIKLNQPEIFSKARYFIFPKDYIIFKLTGEISTDYSMASRTMLFNIHELRWDKKLCERLEIPVEKLPPPVPSPQVVGEVSEKASKLTGLPEGVPVVAGGGDRPCECLGGGGKEAGDVVLGTGTGSVVEVVLDKPKPDEKTRTDCCCHVIPGKWEYEITMMTTGASLRWFRDVFAQEEKALAEKAGKTVYQVFDEEASKISPGSEDLFFYPYFAGAKTPVYNLKASAVFHGIRLKHSKSHFIRSILEGVTFQYAGALQIASELGVDVKKVTVVGGEAKSSFWNQLKADILGAPITITRIKDAAALGSAILAAAGSKEYSNVVEAAENMVYEEKIYEPRRDIHEAYQRVLERYWKIYRELEGSFSVGES